MLHWEYLFKEMREHCFILVENANPCKPVAVALSWPFALSGGDVSIDELSQHGIAWLLAQGVQCHLQGLTPNWLGVGGISVHRKARHKGYASLLLAYLKERAGSVLHLEGLLIAVRPTCKVLYPSVPQAEYIHWKRHDGELFDPWLRLHARAGGQILGTCPFSNVTMHKLAAFQRWTGRTFSESGSYFVEGAVAPVWVDVEHGYVMYIEEDVWVMHAL